MAKKKKTKKNKISAKDELKKLNVPILTIDNNIVFTKKEVWGYYKLSTVPYEFLSPEAKGSLANSTISALASVCQNAGKKVDGHILTTNTPFDIASWANQVDRVFTYWKNDFNGPYEKFMEQQMTELAAQSYQKPAVYLGIKLYNRGSLDMDNFNVFEFGFADAYDTFKRGVRNLFVIPDENVDDHELENARAKEKEIYRTLANGALKAKRVSSQELLLTLKRQFYPAMPTPFLEVDHDDRISLNDIAIETGGIIENKYRYLKFTQMIDGEEYEGYRATLSFAKFPANLSMPGPQTPFLYMPASQNLPYTTMNSRFTMLPHQDMKKDLNKKKLETDDEVENLSNSGQAVNASIEGTVRDLSIMEGILEDDKAPWLNGAYRVTIEMPTYESLKDAITSLKQAYAEEDTTLMWTTGDQLDLFIEEMPGANIMMNSFNQKTNLAQLGVSGFNIGGVAGDPIDEKLVLTERR